MNDIRTLPALATAGVSLAFAAPALAIGAAIGLGLLWLFRDDEQPQTATATPGNKPPAPDAKRKSSGWFFDNEPEAPAAPPTMTAAERQQRIQDNEAKIARLKREQSESAARIAKIDAELNRERQRRAEQITTPAPVPVPVAVRVVPGPKPLVTMPASPVPVVTVRPPAPDVATPARPVTAPAATPQAAAPKFSGWAPKVKREDLAAIFGNGAKRLTRKEAVAALMSKGVKKTTAYHTLREGGRFSNLLEAGADGLLAFRV